MYLFIHLEKYMYLIIQRQGNVFVVTIYLEMYNYISLIFCIACTYGGQNTHKEAFLSELE